MRVKVTLWTSCKSLIWKQWTPNSSNKSFTKSKEMRQKIRNMSGLRQKKREWFIAQMPSHKTWEKSVENFRVAAFTFFKDLVTLQIKQQIFVFYFFSFLAFNAQCYKRLLLKYHQKLKKINKIKTRPGCFRF